MANCRSRPDAAALTVRNSHWGRQMTTTDKCLKIAVVGLGPRGLGAIEALARRSGDLTLRADVDLFDSFPWAGAGPNFSPDQSPLCLLNIPLRAIKIGAAEWPGADMPDFSAWLNANRSQPERYPARAELGAYLGSRLDALLSAPPAGLYFRQIARKGAGVRRDDAGWWLFDSDGDCGPYDEVLLTQGQPRSLPDQQLDEWQDHASDCGAALIAAYPDHSLLRAASNWSGKQVGVRGLGLSTLDVVRLLTCGLGGRFEGGRYIPSGREPACILPFSLDGHLPVPKPASAALDARFDPTDAESAAFKAAVLDALSQPPEEALDQICAAMTAPALRILGKTGGVHDLSGVETWLAIERKDAGAQETRSPEEALRAGIAEANGEASPSVGYVVGQLMRKWQDHLRRAFNAAHPATDAVAKAVVGFDEGLKRYSYGPPVSSAQELAILIEAGQVDLRLSADPDIRMTDDGWQLQCRHHGTQVTAMVDAVLPAADLSLVSDPLMAGLVKDGRAVACSESMGARIAPDGRLIDLDGTAQDGLCLLGRLALGSVIAVDSIHDCFGAAADRWAAGVVGRSVSRA